MSQIVLFHHALGMTPGVGAFAVALEQAGHVVHTPDLFEGQTFTDVRDGVAYAQSVGWTQILDRGREAVQDLPPDLIYAGFSLGAMPAQALAQTRRGALGALLYYSAAPTTEFGTPWPDGLPLQMHIARNDPWDDLPVCRELAASVPTAELFVYPGSTHLFAEEGSADYEPESAALCLQRTLAFVNAHA